MATTQAGIVLRHVRGLAAAGKAGQLADGQLLERFTAGNDPAAFEALLRRHGPMVLGVCRRLLRDPHDAEDAFQATFCALAQKARSVRQAGSVGGWLYQVACNAALKARAGAAVRLRRERRAGGREAADPLAELTGRELVTALDEELRKLPERCRAPLVLCYLEGKTRDEAARDLGWTLGTLKRRLEQGRACLRARLERRGVAFSALLAAGVAAAAVPPTLAGTTARAAQLASSGQAAVPAAVASLTAGALKGTTAASRKALLAVLAALVLTAAGAGLLATHEPAADPPPARRADVAPAPAVKPAPAAPAAGDKEMTVTGRVLGADGKPVAGASVVVLASPNHAVRAVNRDKVLAEGKTDADGRFRLPTPRTSWDQYQQVYVVATAEKHAPAWRRFNPDVEQPDAELKLPPEQIIRGSFVDLQGLPAAKVKVFVSYVGRHVSGQPDVIRPANLPRHAPWPEPVTTDDKGRFVIRGCNRDQGLMLAASDDRFATQSFEIDTPGKPRPESRVMGIDRGGFLHVQESGPDEKGQPDVLKLTLAPARVFTGRVVYEDTGKPAAKALVGGAQTDDDGRFLFRSAGRGGVTLEVFAPEGEPYLNVFLRVEWPKGTVKQETTITLPRGALLRGRVTEVGSGKPVAGAAVQFRAREDGDSKRPKNVLSGWFVEEVTKDDGTFRMVVWPEPGHLLVRGPTGDYVHEEIGSNVIHTGQPGGRRLYPDAFVKVDVPAKGEPKEVAVTLRRGATVRGKLLDPDGKPVAKALMMHRLRVGIDLGWSFPEEVRDGVFEVHGLDPEKSVPVYFLDAEHQCGATVQLSGKQAGETVTVKLAPCGKATARYVDAKGQPRANYSPSPEIIITPGAAGRVIVPGKGDLLADSGSLTNLDRRNYWDKVKTDAKGRVTFPALIPGATYRVDGFKDDYSVPHKEFTVESGKTIDLGDVAIDRKE
jgi:RNA polymerase sigma factor (sigma-70 family)